MRMRKGMRWKRGRMKIKTRSRPAVLFVCIGDAGEDVDEDQAARD